MVSSVGNTVNSNQTARPTDASEILMGPLGPRTRGLGPFADIKLLILHVFFNFLLVSLTVSYSGQQKNGAKRLKNWF